jgi:hypothetical protein
MFVREEELAALFRHIVGKHVYKLEVVPQMAIAEQANFSFCV